MFDDFLKTIAAEKQEMIKQREAYFLTLKKNMSKGDRKYYGLFKKAISETGRIRLIAEVKKASPSVGLIRNDFHPVQIAQIYQKSGADAISVLTEEKYFLGRMSYLRDISDAIDKPTLMKDFIIHEYQIYEGAFMGASAVLLIVAMLSDAQLKDLYLVARHLGLDCLVEVHSGDELERALRLDVDIIGVNNRNLHTLKVDLNQCLDMMPRISKNKVIVAESGLKTADDIKTVEEKGAHAVLIGETFMRSPDIAMKMQEILPQLKIPS